ncbi:hypothetical protein GR7B_00156 [Vibrio phage vB_VcorM_GR7B]|nr:hypothetical protein GR7B_00156 [Vibrio phage vB_VcorM_GR7B]
MHYAKVINGRFNGYLPDLNAKGASGKTYGDCSKLSLEQRKAEGIYKVHKVDNKPQYVGEDGTKVTYPESFLVQSGHEAHADTANAEWLITTTYILRPVAELRTMKVQELKELRKSACLSGFYYKSHLIESGKDEVNSVTAIQLQYDKGTLPVNHIYSFRVTDAIYVDCNIGKDGNETSNGAEGFEVFAMMMANYVQLECFGREKTISLEIMKMTAKQLAMLDLPTTYQPDCGTPS